MLPKEVVLKTIAKMGELVSSLESSMATEWSSYGDSLPYEDDEHENKKRVFQEMVEQVPAGHLAWDVGANDGTFSDILARRFERVLALDSDSGAVERNYRAHSGTDIGRRVTPAVIDITDPPAGRGWRNVERLSLNDRARPNLAAWLAVIHHLSITAAVPLSLVAENIAATSTHAIVEWIDPSDPQVELLLAGFEKGDRVYSESDFRAAVESHSEVLAEEEISPTRRLLLTRAR